jgi:hypothetical protein
MVPARFIHLDKIPLTSNGKLDSGKLTAVVSLESEVHSIDEEGWSPAEKAVAQAFREILDLDRVSLEQNFFESGGHSLKAMSLMSLLHSRQRVGVPLVYLYKHPNGQEDCRLYRSGQVHEYPVQGAPLSQTGRSCR